MAKKKVKDKKIEVNPENMDNASANVPNETIKVSPKLIIKTIATTLGIIICALSFFVVTVSAIAPKFMAQSLNNVGCHDASYLIYKRVYEREQTNENLYNVIQLAIERNEYEDVEHYIEKMINGDYFYKFREKVDKNTKLALGEKYSVYADSYEDYLMTHLTIALYNNEKSLEAKMLAIDSIYSNATELYVYTLCIINDETLLDSQKRNEFNTLKSRYQISSQLTTRITELEESKMASSNNYEKIAILEQSIRIAEIQYRIASYTQDDVAKDSARANINLWTTEINALV